MSQTRPGTWQSLLAAATSWRVASVVLLSFSSGLPFGVVAKTITAWMTYGGHDVVALGWLSLTRMPWSFKFLWSPLMDRFAFPFLGRKRSWMIVAQVGLIATIASLAFLGDKPGFAAAFGLALLIAFFSATQDVAIDAYAVEVLEKEEQGIAVGARQALWRGAFFVSAGLGVTLSSPNWLGSWPIVWVLIALLFVPLAAVVVMAPEPASPVKPPMSLREAVFDPLVSIFRTSHALEIMAFVVLYKLGDNLATALTTPFLVYKKFTPEDVGVATATLGLFGTLGGGILGGALTGRLGLGHSLWLFGAFQALSNLGYVAVDQTETNRAVMYSAILFDNVCQGVGTGAFGVLLLRLTQRRFSATQYALLSSLFAIGGIVAGPPSGVLVDAMGWSKFFVLTVFSAIPGFIMLQRFAPLGVREPEITLEDKPPTNPITRGGLVVRFLMGTAVGLLIAVAWSIAVAAMRLSTGTATKMMGFDLEVAARKFDFALLDRNALAEWLHRHAESTGVDYSLYANFFAAPEAGDWIRLAGSLVFALIIGAATAALIAARRGIAVPAASPPAR